MRMVDGGMVLRRCARCKLLFEAPRGEEICIVCGTAVEAMALTLPPTPLALADDSVPHEIRELEPTTRLAPFAPPRRPSPRS